MGQRAAGLLCGGHGFGALAQVVLLIVGSCLAPMVAQQITAETGKTFTVQLQAAAGAGYLWEVQALPSEIRLESSVTEVPEGARPGDPARQKFQFRALKPGEYTITFVYRRKWESAVAATHAVVVKVR